MLVQKGLRIILREKCVCVCECVGECVWISVVCYQLGTFSNLSIDIKTKTVIFSSAYSFVIREQFRARTHIFASAFCCITAVYSA